MTDEALGRLLSQPRSKIQRANKHISDLNGLVKDFLEQRPFRLWSRFTKKPYQRQIFVKEHQPVPDEIPLVLGDAVHNLKSALDILIYQLVHDKTRHPHRIYFPFATSQEGLEGSISSGQVGFAGEDVVAVIRELKPYAGGNQNLYGVQTLDTRDKHRLIIAVGQVANITGYEFGFITGIPIAGDGIISFVTPTGSPLVTQSLAGSRNQRRTMTPFEREENAQPAFEICFGPDQGFDGYAVIPTLRKMAATVEHAVEAIGSAFIKSR